MAEFSITGLRVLRDVAERGSFTAAAHSSGYTQSAISRQVAALERAAGQPLFERRRAGVRLTPAGARLLARATRVLAELDAASRELADPDHRDRAVRLGAFPTAIAALVPRALAALARENPRLIVTLREGTTPVLVRALRAGRIDLAVLASAPPFRPFDDESPALEIEPLAESELLIAVGPGHPLAARGAVDVDELAGERWVASPSEAGEALLGVWPGLPGRPIVAFTVRDWLGKVGLVASGLAITTVPPAVAAALPPEIHLVAVRGEPHERRRLVVARAPGSRMPAIDTVAEALRAAVARTRAYATR